MPLTFKSKAFESPTEWLATSESSSAIATKEIEWIELEEGMLRKQDLREIKRQS